MEKDQIYHDNVMFFFTAVGETLGRNDFARVVLESSLSEISQIPTDGTGKPGYIRINTSEIRKGGEDCWDEFAKKVRKRFLRSISFMFGSNLEFKGDLAEKIEVEKDGYRFIFEVCQYERDKEHDFKIVEPTDLANIPEDEKLGRVVYLIITPE